MTTAAKDFDLVLFGATGFTGKLVAEYLLEKHTDLKWAMAGRNRGKLDMVRADLARVTKAAAKVPIVVGDSLDPDTVGAMVDRTRVVCTTVGPYARYGRVLASACAERGVDYCDLTGESPFIRAVIDADHERAVKSGARIVPSCGFDSIPSDLGVLMLHEHFAARKLQLAEAHYRLVRMKGGASGGTIASMFGIMEAASDPAVRRVLMDPYALDPAGSPRGPDGADQMGPRRDGRTGRWTGPFVMAGINTRIVRRSNALLGHRYGKDFRYDESTELGSGPAGFARATGLSLGIGAFVAAAATGPGRRLVSRFLPAPGEGPSREERESGSFRVELHGVATDGSRATGVVAAKRDPGYGATAIMLGEAALCLASGEAPARGGVLTTASCMGMKLVDRLRAAGMTFEVEDA
jgi:short subunit dehydrogenase-like uncharacterized protein